MTREKEFSIVFAGYQCPFPKALAWFILDCAIEKELINSLSWQILSFYGDSWGFY